MLTRQALCLPKLKGGKERKERCGKEQVAEKETSHEQPRIGKKESKLAAPDTISSSYHSVAGIGEYKQLFILFYSFKTIKT